MKNGKDFIFYFSINIKQTHWLLRQKENSLHCPPGRTQRGSVLQSCATTPGFPEKLVFQSPCSFEDVLKTESFTRASWKDVMRWMNCQSAVLKTVNNKTANQPTAVSTALLHSTFLFSREISSFFTWQDQRFTQGDLM